MRSKVCVLWAIGCGLLGMGQSQLTIPAPAAASSKVSGANGALELPHLRGTELPPAPPVLRENVIPSLFLGCWTGNPGRFDSVVSTGNTFTIGAPGRIVFCYRHDHIDVPEAGMAFSPGDWALNVALHLGLGITTVAIDTPEIRNEIYAITPTQIHSRTFVPTNITDRILYLLPIVRREILVDEELVTLIDSRTLLVEARQALELPNRRRVRTWHAYFHRTRRESD
jgi:hypothetical protein